MQQIEIFWLKNKEIEPNKQYLCSEIRSTRKNNPIGAVQNLWNTWNNTVNKDEMTFMNRIR